MGRGKTSTALGVMYIDSSKKRTLVEKLEWMTSAYIDRLGIKPKIFILPPETAEQEGLEELREQIRVQIVGRPLREHHFVLCQKLSDYLVEKEKK